MWEEPPDAERGSCVTEEERCTIRNIVLLRLVGAFGLWQTFTKKVFRWQIVPNKLDVVLLDSDCGTVVVPYRKDVDRCPYFGKVSWVRRRPNGSIDPSGRHSNIAPYSPSVAWDRDILYLRPMTVWELEETIRIVQRLKDGLPIEDSRPPPGGDPPLLSQADAGADYPGNTWSTYRAVFHRDGGRCQLCGAEHGLHIDHKIPRAKGGSDSEENLWVLCARCNLSKSDTI